METVCSGRWLCVQLLPGLCGAPPPDLRLIGALARAVRRLGGNPSIEKVARGADPGAAGAPLAEIQGGAWKEYTADLQAGLGVQFFIDCVKDDRPISAPAADLDEAVKTMDLAEAILSGLRE